MTQRLTFIHTVPALAEEFEALVREHLPAAEVDHVVAEELLQQTVDAGELQPETIAALGDIVDEVDRDVDLVMVTCSTLGPAVDALASEGRDRLLRVDEAMARRAVREGTHIGVLATLRSTLQPTTALLQRFAADEGRDIRLTPVLTDGAFEARAAGDNERHDRMVEADLRELAEEVDVILLAQASTARVADQLDEPLGVPVFSSPVPAVELLAERISAAG